ncbi:lasso peptide biosynthesis B2 protein [Asticcacaulis benevestitus]|uniref:Microcin J25-processing protein McjB C-terminal domain-containing protein n=1 Tax=Asticcacaulis benevestitus DSM 16100 = ATCC BAA-896 TaxID=1121022 RepID=V4PF59_9CAUL|nr:lasso peptide biosynthesis B2 protein [Asticcacaulis benevestitus]ESQ92587.1 hypothetical protein ABENE_08085 [Asticcacaulis benevestitus DSM 16100 = ATCC BAA-896]
MSLHLRKGVFHCLANGKIACLDLPADRYFALPAHTEAAFQNLVAGHDLNDIDLAALAPLLQAGLLIEGADTVSTETVEHIGMPSASVLTAFATHSGLPIGTCLEALACQLGATLALKYRRLNGMIDAIRQRKHVAAAEGQKVQNSPPLTPLHAHLALRRLIPHQDQCLRRSLGLIDLLARHQFYPNLVIGVRMKPFEAHAWVQWNEMVLNDEVDHVLRYTPILVV